VEESRRQLPAVTDPMPIGGTKIYFVARPNSVQTNLIVGLQAIERTNPTTTVQVMNRILGGGPTGRLLSSAQEKSYTTGAYSGLTAPLHPATVRVDERPPPRSPIRAARPGWTKSVRWREQPVADEELADAQRAMTRVVRAAVAGIAADAAPTTTSRCGGSSCRRIITIAYAERVSAVTKESVCARWRRKSWDPRGCRIVRRRRAPDQGRRRAQETR